MKKTDLKTLVSFALSLIVIVAVLGFVGYAISV
jgi:hypothetical protein